MPRLHAYRLSCYLVILPGLGYALLADSVALAQPPLSPYPAPYYQPLSLDKPTFSELSAPSATNMHRAPANSTGQKSAAPTPPISTSIPSRMPSDNPPHEGGQERGCIHCDALGSSCLDKIRSLFHRRAAPNSHDLEADTYLYSPTESRWHLWKKHEKPCKHPLCAYPHIFLPFELYGRMSVVWLVGGGKLDRTLDPGIGAEIGIRQFLYDDTKPAAWFGELGFEFTYHNGGEDPDLPIFTIREWNVYWVRVALGREWYFGSGEPGAWTFLVGAFTGGRFGSANTKFLDEPYRTDNIGGLFAGGHAGILIPRCGYDLMAEIFTEYGHDWTSWSDLINSDRHIDHIKLGGAIGIRY